MARRGSKKPKSETPVVIPAQKPKPEPKPIKQRAEDSAIAIKWLEVIEMASSMPIPTLKAAPPANQLQQLLTHVGDVVEPEYLILDSFRIWAETPAKQGMTAVADALHALPKLRKALAIALLMTHCSERYHAQCAELRADATNGVYTNSRGARDKRTAELTQTENVNDNPDDEEFNNDAE